MNQLPTADAEAIEAEFAARLSQLSDATPAQPLSQTTDDHANDRAGKFDRNRSRGARR